MVIVTVALVFPCLTKPEHKRKNLIKTYPNNYAYRDRSLIITLKRSSSFCISSFGPKANSQGSHYGTFATSIFTNYKINSRIKIYL